MVNRKQGECIMNAQKNQTFIRGSNNTLFIKFSILIIGGILQLGCWSNSQPKECVEFFHTPSTQRLKEFPRYDLEKQLVIHRCGLDWSPPYDYSFEIAKQGKNIIPILLHRLNNGDYKSRYDEEKTKYGIILIFQRLAENGELHNKEIIPILEKTVSEFKNDWIKESAEESLIGIKNIQGRM